MKIQATVCAMALKVRGQVGDCDKERRKIMGVKTMKRRIFAGAVCEQLVYNVPDGVRNPKGYDPEKPPRKRFKDEEERAWHRDEISRRKFCRIINENHNPSSIYSTLTFDNSWEVHTFEEARQIRRNFARALQRACPDAVLHIVMGRGRGTKRIHFHMISAGVPLEVIKGKWKYLRFTMDDNLTLSEEKKDWYKSQYQGLFYKRYILGLWVLAEGLVYEFLDSYITDSQPQGTEYYISVDYGTLNPFSAGLWSVTGSKAVRVAEYYYDGRNKKQQLTDEEYCDEIQKLAKGQTIAKVIVDPSAASFITALKRRGFRVQQADNSVLDGIRRTAVYLKGGNIMIHRSCKDAIREFGLYRWDEKKTSDGVVKENDHAMDDIRYFCSTVMRKKVREF